MVDYQTGLSADVNNRQDIESTESNKDGDFAKVTEHRFGILHKDPDKSWFISFTWKKTTSKHMFQT